MESLLCRTRSVVVKRVTALLLCTALAGCQAVPGEGPLTTDIVSDAGQSGSEI
ncbi:polysaccharide export protein, partial [Sinorhizobium meliloti]